MSRRVATNTEQVFRQDAVVHATGGFQFRQTVGPSWSDSEEEIVSQASNHGPDRRINEYREAQLPSPPPPPYSERILGDDHCHPVASSSIHVREDFQNTYQLARAAAIGW